MTDAKVLEFIQRVEHDPRLGARVRSVTAGDKGLALAALVRIAQDAGYELEPAALEAGLEVHVARQLSDDELEAAPGGTQPSQTEWAFVSQRASAFGGYFSLSKG